MLFQSLAFPSLSLQITNNNLFDRLEKLYEEGRKKDPEVFKDDIRLSPAKARTVVSYLGSIPPPFF